MRHPIPVWATGGKPVVPHPFKARGIALPVVLILLVAVAFAGLLAARRSTTVEEITNNARLIHVARQAAQSALRYCEAVVIDTVESGAVYDAAVKSMVGRPGERVIEQVANVGSSVSISTMVLGGEESVEESCSSIGTPAGGVYVLNALDGGGKRTFDIDGDGRLDDVAMVFTATGGYGRGHVLASTIPAAQMTPAQLRETQLATQHGEGDAGNTSCRAARFALVGVNNGAISGGVQCSQSWARQQYQLTRPPQ